MYYKQSLLGDRSALLSNNTVLWAYKLRKDLIQTASEIEQNCFCFGNVDARMLEQFADIQESYKPTEHLMFRLAKINRPQQEM